MLAPIITSFVLLFVFVGLPVILLFREYLISNNYKGILDWLSGPYLGTDASYGNYYTNPQKPSSPPAAKPATSWFNPTINTTPVKKMDADGLYPNERKMPPQPCFFSREEVLEGPFEERYMTPTELRIWQNKKKKEAAVSVEKDTKIPEDSERGLFLEQNVQRSVKFI